MKKPTPDPAEALADYLLTDTYGKKGDLLVLWKWNDDPAVRQAKEWYKRRELIAAIRKFYPPQKPKRNRR